jgi:mRNA-degrading endonuclease toxin of MazEF toxin-antitoxin module
MNPGEVFLGRFPFGGSIGSKVRPVLLLTGPLGTVPEVLVAYMSTVLTPVLLSTDLVIDPTLPEHQGTGLKATTQLRLHKLATVHQSDLRRFLGAVSPATMVEVEARLRLLLKL